MPSHEAVDQYFYTGPYERSKFLDEFNKEFSKSSRYRKDLIPSLIDISDFIGKDSGIVDVRWAAYMLATTMWETTCLRTEEITTKKGNKRKIRSWIYTMEPVEEVGHGKGRKYHEAVKVKELPDGSVRVTEHDGDQFLVKPSGMISKLTKNAKMGSIDGGTVSPIYKNDDGIEHEYFGRGYVQLTWWSNYARAGVALGKGLELLLNPELVKTPEIAYQIMSYGMRTGGIFANGRSFNKYFGNHCSDYKNARAMVNGKDHADDIAEIAKKFEAILLKSKAVKQAASVTLINPGIIP